MSGAPPLFATSYRFRFGMCTVIFSSGQPGALACLAWPASHTWHAHAWHHFCCRYYSTWLWTSSDNVAKRRVSTPSVAEVLRNGHQRRRSKWRKVFDEDDERASFQHIRCAQLSPFVLGQTALLLPRTTLVRMRAHAQSCAEGRAES